MGDWRWQRSAVGCGPCGNGGERRRPTCPCRLREPCRIGFQRQVTKDYSAALENRANPRGCKEFGGVLEISTLLHYRLRSGPIGGWEVIRSQAQTRYRRVVFLLTSV